MTLNKSKRVTIEDVASEVGVSSATVSYIVSGSENSRRISAGTRKRVLDAARELGYSRNAAAVTLRRGYSDTLVLLLVRWDLATAYALTTAVVMQRAAQEGLATIVHVAADDDEAAAFLERVTSFNPYGMILVWDSEGARVSGVDYLAAEGLPIVDLMPSAAKNVASVSADRVQGFSLGARHLIDLGHRHIGLIVSLTSRSRTSLCKVAGYRAALEAAGIRFDEDLIEDLGQGTTMADAYTATQRLIERRPDTTALMCSNDPVALAAMTAAWDMGLCVPEQLSVIGYGASEESTFWRPRLTTLRVPGADIASRAMDILINMRSDSTITPVSISAPVELVVAESTAPDRNRALFHK